MLCMSMSIHSLAIVSKRPVRLKTSVNLYKGVCAMRSQVPRYRDMEMGEGVGTRGGEGASEEGEAEVAGDKF